MRPRIALSLSEVLKSQFLLNLFDPCKEFSESVDPGNLPLRFCKWNSGRTEPDAARDALSDAALRANRCAVANFDMAYNANLAPHCDALSHARAA
jgi:hypothetical protein